MRLRFSPCAEADLEEIGDYIARDNPERAVTFIEEIEAHCNRIAENPTAFPKREDIAPGLLMAVHRRYLIFYRIVEKTVRIERVIHGARNLTDIV